MKVGPVDFSEVVSKVEEFVASDSLMISLFRLAQLDQAISVDSMLELGKKDIKDFPLLNVFPQQFYDAAGKRVEIPIILTEGFDSKVEYAMTRRIKQHIDYFVNAAIYPAIHHILIQHGNILSLAHFDALVLRHQFVRSGFERFYSRGILAGFEMDFAVANSLLVPQVENSLRYVMENLGEISSTYIGGVQKEKMLEKALTNPKI